MERTTFSVNFMARKTRLNKHGESQIRVRVTVNGQRAETTIKQTINPSVWDFAHGRAIERTPIGKEMNLYLDTLRTKFLRIHRDMEDRNDLITAEGVMNRYLGKDRPKRQTVLELFRLHNDKCHQLEGIDFARSTVIRYETSFNHTRDFINHTYKKDDYFIDELSRKFIEDYEFYMKTIRNCNHNTTVKYLKNFKKIVLNAVANGIIDKDPFADYRFSYKPVIRDFLTQEEIKNLVKKKIKVGRLENVRDIFVFCCFTDVALIRNRLAIN